MKLDDVIKLLGAGFTAEEIRVMAEKEAPEPDAGVPDKAPEPEAPAPEVEPEPMAGNAEKDNAEMVRLLKGLEQSINNLRVTIGANAARIGETGSPERETVEDMLAEIINPTYKKERG